MPRIPFICLAAAALAVVSGCGSASPDGQSPAAATSSIDGATTSTTTAGSGPGTGAGSSAESNSSTEPDTAPGTEQAGGTEPAGPAQGSTPSFEVAGLPIGVNADGNCLYIRLLSAASEVPPGMRLVITGVVFDPPTVKIGTAGCSGQNVSCLGLALTESSTDECVVPIAAAGTPPGAGSSDVSVQASIDCPPGQTQACLDYQHKIIDDLRNQGPVTVGVPESSPESSTDTSASESSTGTSSGPSSDTSSDSSSGG